MRFQSKHRNYKLMYRAARWDYTPDRQRVFVPGIVIEFGGPQRIFDSEKVAREKGWDNETKDAVEDYILKSPKYGNGVYLGPGQELPVEKQDKARVKPAEVKRVCKAIGFNDDGDVEQCKNEPGVGRDYCAEHDPEEAKITRGLSTTAD